MSVARVADVDSVTSVDPTDGASPETAPLAPSSRAWTTRATSVALKVVAALAVLLGAATVVFAAQVGLSGDRATILLNIQTGQPQERTAAELAPINKEFGFKDPILVQYGRYIGGILRGDLGISYQYHAPVTKIIGEQLWPTVQLAIGGLVIAWLLTLLSIATTTGQRRWLRGIASASESIAASLPSYWLGVILLVVFAVNLRWFPVMGTAGWSSAILPMVTLAIPLAGFLAQSTRDEFDRVMRQPFITASRMRGQSDVAVRLRHALRHSVIPAVTLSGWALGSLISGTVLVETIYSRPGLGQVLLTAVNARDLPVVAGVVILVAFVYIVANLIVDIAYTVIDPRRRAV